MQLHELKKTYKTKTKKRIGRGGKRGTYSGKGMKGQKSRAGKKIRPAERDYIKRLHKKRGFKFSSNKEKPVSVNIFQLEKYFNSGETVSPKTLFSKNLIKKQKGKLPQVKILATGKTNKKFVFKECGFSEVASKELGIKIEKKKKIVKNGKSKSSAFVKASDNKRSKVKKENK